MDSKSRFGHLEMEGKEGAAPTAEKGPAYAPGDYLRQAFELELNGSYEDVLRLYARALGRDPHLEEAWVGQLRCLLAREEFHEAQVWARKASEYLPRSAQIVALEAVALARDGRQQEGLTRSDDALKLSGQGPLVWFARAWVHGKARADMAERCIDKALEQAAGDPFPRVEAALLYLHLGKHGLALQHLQAVTAQRPALARPWYLMGLCMERLGMRRQAVAALAEAAGRAPANRRYRDALVELQRGGGVAGWLRRYLGL